MKKYFYTLLLTLTTLTQTFAQSESPYKTSFKVDAPVTVVGMGLSGLGLYLMQQKDPLTEMEALRLNKNDVNSFDRFAAGYASTDAKKVSDVMLYSSLVSPALLFLDSDISSNVGQTLALYVETMAVTGTIFTMSSAAFPRTRPLAYNKNEAEVPLSDKTRKNARNSFFAGHTAAVATATFFAAKVFHDYNPDATGKGWVWAGAAAVPATVGYLRIKAGKHFLSDNIIGYGVGAAVGILVPQLHKTKGLDGLSFSPTAVPVMGRPMDGFTMQYTF